MLYVIMNNVGIPGSGTMPADSGEAIAGQRNRKNINPAAATSSLPGNFSPTVAHNILQTCDISLKITVLGKYEVSLEILRILGNVGNRIEYSV